VKKVKIAYPFLLLALLAPATASAQTPPPDERAAAQAFAAAAGRFTDAIAGPTNRYFAFMDHPTRRLPGCPAIPKRRLQGRVIITFNERAREFVREIKPATLAFRSELADVATTDRALISGRAAWRRSGRELELVREPADVCAELSAWRRAGYPRSTVRAALRELGALNDSGSGDRSRKLAEAVRRMGELGVPEEEAQLFANPYREEESSDSRR